MPREDAQAFKSMCERDRDCLFTCQLFIRRHLPLPLHPPESGRGGDRPRAFNGRTVTSSFKLGTPVATLPGVWCCGQGKDWLARCQHALTVRGSKSDLQLARCDSTIVPFGKLISIQVCDFFPWFLLMNWTANIFLIPTFYSTSWVCFDVSVSPWDNRTGWLGVKH